MWRDLDQLMRPATHEDYLTRDNMLGVCVGDLGDKWEEQYAAETAHSSLRDLMLDFDEGDDGEPVDITELRYKALLAWLAVSSWGDQALKSMLVLHSDSGSGKSMLTSILHDIYGTYCFPMTTQSLNGVDSGGPKPELVRHATMRCGIINEATAL